METIVEMFTKWNGGAGHWIWALILLWNLAAFLTMGWDKRQAKNRGCRVPEKTLFLMAFTLAGPGILLGMSCFRHKTKHLSFQIGVPLGILVNCAMIYLVFSGKLL